MKPDFMQLAEDLEPKLIQTRRHIHQNPELSFQETDTSQYISERLEQLGVPFRAGIAKTGIVAEINGKAPGKTLLIRADMDALPVREETGAEYCSRKTEVMHACGHDGHTAILLGVCEVLNQLKEQFTGTVKLVFQPGEETTGGAQPMIEAGILQHPNVDAAVALHMDPDLDCGTMRVKSGPVYASPDDFEIIIYGKGGHGAEPQLCIDPILIAAKVIEDLQLIVSRRVDPFESAVISICSIHAGSATNVIPDMVQMKGTARSMTFETREKLAGEIETVVRQICGLYEASYEYRFIKLFPPLINDQTIAKQLYHCGINCLGSGNAIFGGPATMAGEDFSYFAKEVPAALFKLGCRNVQKGITAPLHNPKFDLDEECLKYGVMIFADFALRFLD